MRSCPDHGVLHIRINPRGGSFCSKCWQEKKNSGRKVLHDKTRNPKMNCTVHGPHYVVKGWSDDEFCLACGPADKRKLASGTNTKCKLCDQETKKQNALDEIEKVTRPTYQETVGQLNMLENFTRIKNAT